ncbi:ABC transporter ATP-binding protein [uncultured Nisaea sp.]|uniref:ABC transporter ATP-binding protein n=1 Tax=uncultured Nisaea sp. TaxID=538215 RepID=UPI0030EEC19D|tara:strand:- start:513 stop:1208 length:696 start_codon:yes stop_codon:yes gene_type:complete
MLKLDRVSAGYGPVQVLHEVSFEAVPGEVLCLLGRNGAGKTTTLKAIMGLVKPSGGKVLLDGQDISALPAEEAPKRGIGYIPQGRRLFSELTVAENIEIGLMARDKGTETRERVLEMFPRLRERLDQRAETLSGGEQQMLATARALCLEPSVLMLDEPTEGLQPSMIDIIRETIVEMRAQGVAVILVEQRIEAVLSLADRVAFLENGHGREIVPVADLKSDQTLLHKYVGV